MSPWSLGRGRYEIRKPLGTGGMAGVYLALDNWFRRECAVKVLLPAAARSKKTQTRFHAEAKTMAVLDHPNVIRVTDVGSEDGQFYFVMELATGGSLADLVRIHGPRSPREALVHVFQVLRGLDYAHTAGVVHRDVKPHNMLLARVLPNEPLDWHEQLEYPVKLTDFGIARHVAANGSRITGTGDTLGTLAYMSPEQRADPRGAGLESDIYGVGATLYLLVTGRRPFDLAMAYLDPGVYERLPDPIAQIVRRATQTAPGDRYRSAREMAEAVAAAWHEADPSAGPATGSDRMSDFAADSHTLLTPSVDPSLTPST